MLSWPRFQVFGQTLRTAQEGQEKGEFLPVQLGSLRRSKFHIHCHLAREWIRGLIEPSRLKTAISTRFSGLGKL